jgi:hypothetical protein
MTLTLQPPAKKRALGLLFFIILMDVIGISILYALAALILRLPARQTLAAARLSKND